MEIEHHLGHYLYQFNESLKIGAGGPYFTFNCKISLCIQNVLELNEVVGYQPFLNRLKEINVNTFWFNQYHYYSQVMLNQTLVLLTGLIEINKITYPAIATMVLSDKIGHFILQIIV